jgi:hypothetical protein
MATVIDFRSTGSFLPTALLPAALLAATLTLPAAGQATSRVNVATGGAQANRDTTNAWISADGRYVAFASYATNLAFPTTNPGQEVFIHDRQTGLRGRNCRTDRPVRRCRTGHSLASHTGRICRRGFSP